MTQAAYKIVIDRSGKTGYIARGAALELWKYRGNEVMISGPAETGKSYAACKKLNRYLWKYPGSQGVMLRKIRDTLHSTIVQTYLKVIGHESPIMPYGGKTPSWFDYPNGSRLWLGGLDDPGKTLSSERDIIYVNQAEETTLTDWETLLTRATGRAGNAPYPQVIGDCNPGSPQHWIKQRKQLKIFESRHEDNPTLWDDRSQRWTEQGTRTLDILDSLTGVRKERLRFGRWVSAEGTVYQFDPRVHLLDWFQIPASWPRFRSFDFGFTNPFVCQFWAMDPDGRLYLYREIYHTQRTVRVHALQVKSLSFNEKFVASVSDHDAEDRATLLENQIHTLPAEKAITVGREKVEERLKVQKDGKPRLFVLRGALVERDEELAGRRLPVSTEQEFDVYVYAKTADGRPIKEEPLDLNNHGMDAMRYMVMYADRMAGRQGCGVHSSPGHSVLDQMPPDVFT